MIDKINKLSLPATILIVSLVLGGFYYASEVNKQKSIERQQQIKIEQEKQDQLKAQQAGVEARQALDNCLASADTNYSDSWYRECKGEGKLTDKCISLHDTSFVDYAKQNNIPQDKWLDVMDDFYKQREDCSCRLSINIADIKNKTLQDQKDLCFKQYPQK